MALFRAALLAASLGSGAVFALPQEAPSSTPDTFSIFKAHTESKQPNLLVPSTTTPDSTATLNSPSLETPGSHLSLPPAGTPKINAPHTETQQHHLDIPTTEAPAPATHPDLRRSTEAPVDQHQVPGGGDTPYTPPVETTLYAAGTPVVAGPAGTAIIIHGTPVVAGLPAAVIDGTTYAYGAGTVWVNGSPAPLANPTPYAQFPDGHPHYPEVTQATWHETHGTDWPGVQPTTHAKPEPTTQVTKPTTKSDWDNKATDKPSPPSTSSMTWTGPGLTTETGIGEAANAAVHLLPGLSLAVVCFLITLM